MTETNQHESIYKTFGKQVLTGSFATAAVIAGEKLVVKLAKHPVLVFGLGMISGGVVYRNRKAIIEQAEKTVETGKQVVLEQREKLLDLVAETKQSD